MSNKCTTCGKERIVIKTYKEKIGTSCVTFKEMTCPDPECQKRINKVLSSERAKRQRIKDEKERAELERKKTIAENLKNKQSLLLRNKQSLLLRNKQSLLLRNKNK
ncbi:MAG: hypothetical protein ABIJ85_03955 [bacterium]